MQAQSWAWRSGVRLAVVLGLAAIGVVSIPGLSRGQVRRPVPTLGIESLGGSDSFQFYCAPCHGRTGVGDGSVGAALRNKPADLTTLAERNGGEFPRERVRAYVAGEGRTIPAHGASDMPVWGPAFKALDASDTRAQVRIDAIVNHIESLQKRDNGAELYRAHCASCHGTNGKGNGPLAAQLRREPPDLTHFTMRNGGMFPTERVRRIIDGREVPSHGDREMPVWGSLFRRTANDVSDEAVEARIAALVRYLRSIQERPAE